MTVARALVTTEQSTQPVNFGLLSGEGRVLFVNDAWRAFGQERGPGIRPVEVGRNYLDTARRADSPAAHRIAAVLEQVLVKGVEVVETTYSWTSGCEERRFLMQANRFSLNGEQYVAVVHVDVTGHDARQHDLDGFRQVIEAAGHAIFVTDSAGRITYVNPAFEHITGYSADEAVGRTPAILKSGEMAEGYYDRLWETLLRGDVWDELIVNRRQSGELYYAHQTIAPVLGDDGEPVEFVAMQTDVTQLRATKRGTEKLGTMLRHDLRNELSVAQSYAELIQQRGGEVAVHAGKIVETISNLLETSEKGIQLQRLLVQPHHPVPRDVGDDVSAVVESARDEYPAVEIDHQRVSGAVALCLPEVDVALAEIVENAIVHNDSDSPRVDVSVTRLDEWVEIRITDDGPGIPEMEYAALESDTTDLYHDTGLGLNLAYWIVRRSGGTLTFDERDSGGTTIAVRLPRQSV